VAAHHCAVRLQSPSRASACNTSAEDGAKHQPFDGPPRRWPRFPSSAFFGILIEHYAGGLPAVARARASGNLPGQRKKSRRLRQSTSPKTLKRHNLRVHLDDRNEKLPAKNPRRAAPENSLHARRWPPRKPKLALSPSAIAAKGRPRPPSLSPNSSEALQREVHSRRNYVGPFAAYRTSSTVQIPASHPERKTPSLGGVRLLTNRDTHLAEVVQKYGPTHHSGSASRASPTLVYIILETASLTGLCESGLRSAQSRGPPAHSQPFPEAHRLRAAAHRLSAAKRLYTLVLLADSLSCRHFDLRYLNDLPRRCRAQNARSLPKASVNGPADIYLLSAFAPSRYLADRRSGP